MQSLYRFTVPPSTCGYLPDRDWSLEYEMVADLSAAEFAQRLEEGWRRFGAMMFRPQCPACTACQTLRVDVAKFQPNRSQRRTWHANHAEVAVRVGAPQVTRARLRLYDRFHEMQTEVKGWPEHGAKDVSSYRESFVDNPPFTEEWCYYLDERLVGIGYVDRLIDCMSAIYFFYDPELRDRSLGTFNVLCLLEECKRRELKFLYLGYYVEGCRSLEYKANFKPNQVRCADGTWRDFQL
jgi:arginyl-tRNA--protein-N-Asp/Glu arginylyltransferase